MIAVLDASSVLGLRPPAPASGVRNGATIPAYDFRHPGNAHLVGPVGSVADEVLAVVTGRGTSQLTDTVVAGLGPRVG
jgi:hypothetical protein